MRNAQVSQKCRRHNGVLNTARTPSTIKYHRTATKIRTSSTSSKRLAAGLKELEKQSWRSLIERLPTTSPPRRGDVAFRFRNGKDSNSLTGPNLSRDSLQKLKSFNLDRASAKRAGIWIISLKYYSPLLHTDTTSPNAVGTLVNLWIGRRRPGKLGGYWFDVNRYCCN